MKEIYYTIQKCKLGHILVSKTAKGICAIFFDNSVSDLKNHLQSRFPNDKIILDNLNLEKEVTKIIQYVENPKRKLNLALDIRGTPFQQKVWQALCEIPLGLTASYSEVAQKIGLPKAARAVAQACANNAIAVLIPCHRVIRSDGAISGYRWGVKIKEYLLKAESCYAKASQDKVAGLVLRRRAYSE